MAKKINHRGHGGHRELLFSLCPLCSLWFSEAHFQKIIKSLQRLDKPFCSASLNPTESIRISNFWLSGNSSCKHLVAESYPCSLKCVGITNGTNERMARIYSGLVFVKFVYS